MREGRVVRVDDQVADQLAQALARQRHDHAGGQRGDLGADGEQRPVRRREEARRARRDPRELVRRDPGVLRAGHPVDESHSEVEALGVTHESRELLGGGPLLVRLSRLGRRQPAVGQAHRVVHQGGKVLGDARPRHGLVATVGGAGGHGIS
ncbi:hypothetical protein [Georgenia sp. SUBG003]|uniref:hypothetical protein n=1 Tax=Georgenia sp. SUBG003 TaxID=1497974 RepID=UPI0004D40958|nr:hypothetical protein DA06_13375 [Georgenia sp. SUBG003]